MGSKVKGAPGKNGDADSIHMCKRGLNNRIGQWPIVAEDLVIVFNCHTQLSKNVTMALFATPPMKPPMALAVTT